MKSFACQTRVTPHYQHNWIKGAQVYGNITAPGPVFNFTLISYNIEYELTGYQSNRPTVQINVEKPKILLSGIRPKEFIRIKASLLGTITSRYKLDQLRKGKIMSTLINKSTPKRSFKDTSTMDTLCIKYIKFSTSRVIKRDFGALK
ncbi:hypothetical protein pdam_00006542 [Pocillopora damicornis]|uniref:Uncharacterized protein n=1 Tax=Pocillopora damicornis TaxID=46731 RepID=A0A3M6THD3_POCDA|nr:hypothetical protein pdam_00006542 [Pocillopora damicornis]